MIADLITEQSIYRDIYEQYNLYVSIGFKTFFEQQKVISSGIRFGDYRVKGLMLRLLN